MTEAERAAVSEIVERVANRDGLELVHWEAVGPRNNFVLRIFIDKPGGVTHADCETVSHQVGMLLDVSDLISHKYILEVSSPGVNRGLYKPADYERFTGSRVKLRISEALNGRRSFRGRLLSIQDGIVSLDAIDVGKVEIPYDNIEKANIEYEF
ncbi:MAG TPA: ribosome maturation factor RimP [Blastocatellia bacterium]|jgi:ribosome maturation factor RimP|nr:ribosome maturation factor RimP [Blastocatellia bacterium]